MSKPVQKTSSPSPPVTQPPCTSPQLCKAAELDEGRKYYLTQNDDGGKPAIPEIKQFTVVSSDRVKMLSTSSFTLDDKMMIGLKFDDCILVLFYTENKESHELLKLWYLIAEQTPGPIYAACNVLLDAKVSEAFARVKMDGSHPLNPYALHQWPVIMVYRKGFPVAIYNGERDVQSLIDWSLILACRANYFEPIQEFASMQAEYRHDMPSPLPYPDPKVNPEAKVSSQFMSTQSKRGFYKAEHAVKSGSKADEQEAIEAKELRLRRMGIKPTAQLLNEGVVRNPEVESEEEILADIRAQEKAVVTQPKRRPREAEAGAGETESESGGEGESEGEGETGSEAEEAGVEETEPGMEEVVGGGEESESEPVEPSA